MEGLKDKVVLVTGAASGIGRAAAEQFAAAGARVSVIDMAADSGRAVVEQLSARGGDAWFAEADIAQPDQVAAAVAGTVEHFGRLDLAFNNAGYQGVLSPFIDYPEEAFERVFAVNVRGLWHCLQHEMRHMSATGGGAIVNCSSVAGMVGTPGVAAYSASKHAVVGLTRVTALEGTHSNIRVNAICPGVTDTPMMRSLGPGGEDMLEAFSAAIPIGRVARPDEAAAAAVWLCSDAASYLTGAVIPVDGGITAQ